MSVTDQPIEQTSEEEPRHAAADARRMFRWSQFIDIGAGAEECEHKRDGACDDPEHFHAWVRIPNPVQHRDVRERALAAQARKQRALRDPETDAHVILESEIDALRLAGTMEPVVDELAGKDYGTDLLDAQREVMEREEFEHILRDQERMREIIAMPEDEQPADERDELVRHLDGWADAIEAATSAAQERRKEAFRAMDDGQLLDHLRTQRIEAEGEREYMHVYGLWEMVAGAYQVEPHPSLRRPHKHHFRDPGELREQAPEIIDALRETLDQLRVAQQRAAQGNS